MNTYLVKFQSYNKPNYAEVVSAKDEKEARVLANKMVIKHDDRDKIISITEHDEPNVYYSGN